MVSSQLKKVIMPRKREFYVNIQLLEDIRYEILNSYSLLYIYKYYSRAAATGQFIFLYTNYLKTLITVCNYYYIPTSY